MTLREHLELVEKQTKRRPRELDEERTLSAHLYFVWEIFVNMHTSRDASVPITYTEIDAYGRVMGFKVSVWEASVVKRLDRVWFQERS